ncbi:MAG: hypothetical protein J4F39_11540 [Candidatus Latescibacteria bacterium]|nr:hypothetical protein [Candidatus Latescibacterota bacterium]
MDKGDLTADYQDTPISFLTTVTPRFRGFRRVAELLFFELGLTPVLAGIYGAKKGAALPAPYFFYQADLDTAVNMTYTF